MKRWPRWPRKDSPHADAVLTVGHSHRRPRVARATSVAGRRRLEVQDEGSQLVGYAVAPRRSDMVVDFCAGAGGKTLLLGALMRSQGRLYAFDVARSVSRTLRRA